MVSSDIRKIEREIDDSIRAMDVWDVKREVLLRRLMDFWRDGLELVNLEAVHAMTFQTNDGLIRSIANEHYVATGIYQSIKWAMEYAKDDGEDHVDDEPLAKLVMSVGVPYQLLVDSLKMANYDVVGLSADPISKTLTVFEGGQISGHDESIIHLDHLTTPFIKHHSLTDDTDQLTTDWTAGQYRQFWQWIKPIAEAAETSTIVAQAGPLAPMRDIMKRPVVFEVPVPPGDLQPVLRDLTLTAAKVRSALKWKIDSWHDCPLIQIGDGIFGVSLAIRTLTSLEDYMLRIAVLNDSAQYERVSGLREERMIDRCGAAFSWAGWQFTPHFLLSNPPMELDGVAARATEKCVVQLKSTLRPQSPWEVYKRNLDVIGGINHTSTAIRQIGSGTVGFVITDGYDGDYTTWKRSLETGVAVATLDDLDLITRDPEGAFRTLAERAGIKEDSAQSDITARSVSLCGWTIHSHRRND